MQESPTFTEAAKGLPHATPKVYPTVNAAIDAFCRGETEGLLVGYFRAQQLMNQRPSACRNVWMESVPLPEAGSDLSLMSQPESAKVADRLRARIDEMAVDGTLLSMALRYPGIMPGMAVHLSRLAEENASARRRTWLLLASGVVLLLIATLAVLLGLDRRSRLRAERALRASEDRLRLALVAANMRPWNWEEERTAISDPEELRRVEAAVQSALEQGSALEVEYRTAGPSQEERWTLVKAHAAPFRDRLAGIAMDITDRRRAETARAEVEERFRRAVLESPVPMMIYADDGQVLHLSRSWTELTGYTAADIPTVRVWNSVALQRNSAVPEMGECRVVTRRGDIRTWLLSRASLGKLPEGAKLELLAAVDLTDRKQTEEQLRRANAELEQYAYAASHDLQEPMRVIGLYSQLLIRKHGAEFSDTARGYFSIIAREASRMTGIVSGLVSYSRLVCDTDSVPVSRVALTELASTVLGEIHDLIESRTATVQVEPLPTVTGDSKSLASVLRHLLSNAVKYVPPDRRPEVRVWAELQGDEWVISVRDNGPGIAPEYHDRIWGVFRRLHGHEVPGTGIGLAVVRKVIQQHGGRTWVESSGTGDGATFRLTLRAAELKPRQPAERATADRAMADRF